MLTWVWYVVSVMALSSSDSPNMIHLGKSQQAPPEEQSGREGKRTRPKRVWKGGFGLAKPLYEKLEQMSIYSAPVNLRTQHPVRVGVWLAAAGER